MARATLERWRWPVSPGTVGTLFEVQTSPFDADPFPGPRGQDWARFEIVGEDVASFEWRTGRERLLAVLDALSAGTLACASAMTDPLVREYVDRVEAALAEEVPDEILESNRVGDWILSEALERRDEVIANEGPFSFYQFDDDAYFHDAAKALPLPPWASYRAMESGSMGSGYRCAMIVLEPGRRLAELGEWLRAMEEGASPK